MSERVPVHADGGACHGTPLVDGRCPGCGLTPDMQSVELWMPDAFATRPHHRDEEVALICHIITEFKKLDRAAALRVADYARWLAADPNAVRVETSELVGKLAAMGMRRKT